MRFNAMIFAAAVMGLAACTDNPDDSNDGTIDDGNGSSYVDPGDNATLLVNAAVNNDELTNIPYCFMHDGESVGGGQTGVEQSLPSGYDLDEIEIAVGDKDSEMTDETVPRRIIEINGTEYVHRTTQPETDAVDVQLNQYLDWTLDCTVDTEVWEDNDWRYHDTYEYVDQTITVGSGYAVKFSTELDGKMPSDVEMNGLAMIYAGDNEDYTLDVDLGENSLEAVSTRAERARSTIVCN